MAPTERTIECEWCEKPKPLSEFSITARKQSNPSICKTCRDYIHNNGHSQAIQFSAPDDVEQEVTLTLLEDKIRDVRDNHDFDLDNRVEEPTDEAVLINPDDYNQSVDHRNGYWAREITEEYASRIRDLLKDSQGPDIPDLSDAEWDMLSQSQAGSDGASTTWVEVYDCTKDMCSDDNGWASSDPDNSGVSPQDDWFVPLQDSWVASSPETQRSESPNTTELISRGTSPEIDVANTSASGALDYSPYEIDQGDDFFETVHRVGTPEPVTHSSGPIPWGTTSPAASVVPTTPERPAMSPLPRNALVEGEAWLAAVTSSPSCSNISSSTPRNASTDSTGWNEVVRKPAKKSGGRNSAATASRPSNATASQPDPSLPPAEATRSKWPKSGPKLRFSTPNYLRQ